VAERRRRPESLARRPHRPPPRAPHRQRHQHRRYRRRTPPTA